VAYNVLVFYPAEKCEEYSVDGKLIHISGYENAIVFAAKYDPNQLDNASIMAEWNNILTNKDDLIESL
ncbi:hypothetical protein AAVH_23378, partial [Aphelenchoides avenae]